jgi:hypothetical protein
VPQPAYTLATIATHPAYIEMEAKARELVAQAITEGALSGADPEGTSRACTLAFAELLKADASISGPFFTAYSEVLWVHLNPAPAAG